MRNAKKGILGIIILLLLLLIIPVYLFGGTVEKKSKAESKRKADFVLTVKDDLISLSAKDASLKEIVEEIGRRMKIETAARISKKDKITVKFDNLSLEDAVKRLDINYVYLFDSKKGGEKIVGITFLPKETGTAVSPAEKEKQLVKPERKDKSSRPEPFKFEFDPSASVEKEK